MIWDLDLGTEEFIGPSLDHCYVDLHLFAKICDQFIHHQYHLTGLGLLIAVVDAGIV